MSFNIDGARERVVNHQYSVVECTGATWTFKYNNGYIVILRGPLTAHVYALQTRDPAQPWKWKFFSLLFDSNTHEKYVSIEAIEGIRLGPSSPQLADGHDEDDRRFDEPRISIRDAKLPPEPVNAFGIPQATMRCLEVRRQL